MFVIRVLHVYRKTWEAPYYVEYILARHTSGFSISGFNIFTQLPHGYCSSEGTNSHASYMTSGGLIFIGSYMDICVLVKKLLGKVDTVVIKQACRL
jgi:hypothetical protein